MMDRKEYPPHIYDPARIGVASSYLKQEFRKLLWRVPESHWEAIDRDISDWVNSPELATPRDFWNGFHGICMGFKLKIGLIYFITAENIAWKKEGALIKDLSFGVELRQTKVVKPGKLSAGEVIQFYAKPKNKKIKEKQRKVIESLSGGTTLRDEQPIIVTERIIDGKIVLSTYDGNRRLAKAILEDRKTIQAFIGRFTSEEKMPKNYWIPTPILMEILFFTRVAFEKNDRQLFDSHMAVLKNMLAKSESAVYELKERALTSQQPFRNEVLKALDLV